MKTGARRIAPVLAAVLLLAAAPPRSTLDSVLDALEQVRGFRGAAISPDGTSVAWVERIRGRDGSDNLSFIDVASIASPVPRRVPAVTRRGTGEAIEATSMKERLSDPSRPRILSTHATLVPSGEIAAPRKPRTCSSASSTESRVDRGGAAARSSTAASTGAIRRAPVFMRRPVYDEAGLTQDSLSCSPC